MYRGFGPVSAKEERAMRARLDDHLRNTTVVARPDPMGQVLWTWCLSASHDGQLIAGDARSVTMEVGKYRGQRLCDVPGGGEDYMLWLWEQGPGFFGLKQLRELSFLLHRVQFHVDDKAVWESQPLPEAIRGKRFLRVYATTGFMVQKNNRMKRVDKCVLNGAIRPLEKVDAPGKQPREINTLGELWAEIEGALLSKPLWANCMCSHMFLANVIFSEHPKHPELLVAHCAWDS